MNVNLLFLGYNKVDRKEVKYITIFSLFFHYFFFLLF